MTNRTQEYTKKFIFSVLVLSCFGFKNTLKGSASPFVGTWYSQDRNDILTIKNNNSGSLFIVDLSQKSGSNIYHYESCKQTDTTSMTCDPSTTLSIDTVKKLVIFKQSSSPSETFYQTPPNDNPATLFLHKFWRIEDGTKEKITCEIKKESGNSYGIEGQHGYNGALEANFDIKTDPNFPTITLRDPDTSYIRFNATYSLADKTLLINTDKFYNCLEQKYNY